jgi:serine/threonine-protein kinase
VTVQTDPVPGRNTEGLSFVRADTGDGADIGEWQLADDTRTYTLNQTLQLFAVPQPATSLGEAETLRAQSPPEPTPPPRSRAPLIAAGALALAIAAAVAVVWSKTRDPAPRPAASADAIDRVIDAAPDRVYLSVATEPAGADVSLDGEPIGRTPIREREVTPRDKAVVAIAADGFEPVSVSVDLPAGAWIRVNRTLQPTGDSGAVDVLSTPPADVYWRGKKIGRTPLRGLALPAGTHTLVLINRDQARRKVVEITVPGAALIDVEL